MFGESDSAVGEREWSGRSDETSTTWLRRVMGRRRPTPLALLALALALVVVVQVPSPAAGSGLQLVTFTETGLSAGATWSVTVNGVTHASHTQTVTFHEVAGVYTYRVHHTPVWYSIHPSSGSFTVGSAAVSIAITFVAMGTASSIQSNFNGNGIAAGDWIWFNAVLKPASSVPSTGLLVRAVGQTVTLTFKDGSTLVLSVPDARIDFSASASAGATAFVSNRWLTTVPVSFSDNVFMAGLAYEVPAGGLPGGISNVTWAATFSTNSTAGTFQLHWQWAAAVYTSFTNDYNLLGVKPLHSTSLDAYQNGDQAGTPENYTAYVTGGARGGGGSNFTGSYSATASVTPKFVIN
jgi:hypothetical protein